MTDVLHRVETFLQAEHFYRCLLLVHEDIGRLYEAADRLQERYPWPRLSIGREMSATLLPEAVGLRPRRAQQWLLTRLLGLKPGPVLCSEIDLLFEPSIMLDPLALLRAASRSTWLIVLWPGAFANGVLSYATPAHDHYRPWSEPQVSIETLT